MSEPKKITVPCLTCSGTGKVKGATCSVCKGTGKIET
jgi:DnaJ-class molecular chaperone